MKTSKIGHCSTQVWSLPAVAVVHTSWGGRDYPPTSIHFSGDLALTIYGQTTRVLACLRVQALKFFD
jgi:hypothetical protein